MSNKPSLFLVDKSEEHESLLAAVERSMAQEAHTQALAMLPSLTNIALGDPYLATQLAALHQQWEIAPRTAPGLLGRLRTRLAWWLLGPELKQANQVHATLVRIIDSLIVQLDEERAGRRRIEEHLAYGRAEQ